MIGRDHLDAGSVASPQRETEAMRDGSDAVADWPILNALVNTATGASWVSFHHGGGVGMGKSLHAGQVIVADGTPEAGERIRRTLLADPGHGRDPARRRRLPGGARRGRAARGADPDAMRTSIRGAAQVLLPPEDGLPYLRRPDELRLEPGSVTVEDGVIVALEDDPGADRGDRRDGRRDPPGLRRLPHAPAVRGLARGGVRAEGHRRAVRGDRARRRRDRVVGARARRGERRRGASRRRARSAPRCSRTGTTTLEGKTGYGLSREGELRAVRLGREVVRPRHRPVRPRDPGGLRRRGLDGRGRRAGRGGATSTRSTSTSSRSPSATRTSSGWARSRGARACRCAPTSSSSTPTARCRWRWPPARARSTTSPACTPTTSRRWPPPSAPPCCCRAPSSSAPRSWRRGARWPTRARSACWPPTATPARRRSSRCRWSSGSPCAATAGRRARRWPPAR